MSFEDLQLRKVNLAAGLLKKLVDMRPRLFAAEQMEKHALVREWLVRYAAALEDLAKLVRAQKALCKNDQCNVLLDQETVSLEGSSKDIGAIRHIKKVAEGTMELDESKVREALVTITSRQHSLPQLLNAA
jgi:hypothetical protein